MSNPIARRSVSLALGLVLLQAAGIPARAASKSGFYHGKTVSILVGYQAGGGYDLYARVFAQFLGAHIPGEPTVIVQNMPGAGGLRAARNLASTAAKDGTVIGMLAQTLPFDTVLGYTADIDAGKFNWLGRVAKNVEVGVAFARSGIASFDTVRKRPVPVGGTGGTASSTVVPFLLNQLAGARFRLVSGYKSANEVLLAMERGEVEMVGATGLSTMLAKHAAQLKNGTMKLIYQNALVRHPLIANVPTIGELGRTNEEKQILNLFATGSEIGRAIVAPPGIAAARAATLRRAVAATLADPKLVAYAKAHKIMLDTGTAKELDDLVRKTLATPKPIVAKARAVLETMRRKK